MHTEDAFSIYRRAVDNKILVSLRELGKQKEAGTQTTNDAIMQILDYVATYPNDGITF